MKTSHDEHTYDPSEHHPDVRARKANERAKRRKEKNNTIPMYGPIKDRFIESLTDFC